MTGFVPFATPWWVNLLILVPAVPWLMSVWQRLSIGKGRLLGAALFGIAFGFVEAAVVVYLRAATGLWPGPPEKALAIPAALFRIECFREAATVVMLGVIAFFAGQKIKGKFLAFLWTFAFWDFFYYVWLRVAIGWPRSLFDADVLFLIPVPWVAQVWFPLLVSFLTALVIWLRD
ncbi:MAG: hypothetical protein ABSF23_11525 [Terracidiphilus sp.]|jgi:hypothetical protein